MLEHVHTPHVLLNFVSLSIRKSSISTELGYSRIDLQGAALTLTEFDLKSTTSFRMKENIHRSITSHRANFNCSAIVVLNIQPAGACDRQTDRQRHLRALFLPFG